MESKYISTNKEHFTVDRFEEEYAVLESGMETISILKSELPMGANPGDVLVCKDGTWDVDRKGTAALKSEISELFNRIKNRPQT